MDIRLIGTRAELQAEMQRLDLQYVITQQSQLVRRRGRTRWTVYLTAEPRPVVPVREQDARLAVDALRVTAAAGVTPGPELATALTAAADRIAAALAPETTNLPAQTTPGDPDQPSYPEGQ
jgi:hypothetical protein